MEQVLSGGGAGGGDGLSLGSGKPPNAKPKERTSIFDIPQDGAELLQDGEATLQAVAAFWTRLRTEGWDALCGARVLGPVGSVFPRFGEVLSEHGVDPGRVQGAWVVPPFILKDLNGPALRWHEVRGRMGPFLKNELWRRVDAEVRQGSAVAWETMGLMAENVVVVKHAQPWRKLLGDARARLSWPNIKAAARSALTRERAVEFVVWLWPFKWWWLVAWVATLSLILAGHAVTSDVLPTTWHDVAMIWLANLCGGIYALKGRAAADAALSDANSFKTAGSVALRKGKLEVAATQYMEGRTCAAKLAPMWYLNGRFAARGVALQVACLNNAAIVHLKAKDWEKAIDASERVLDLRAAADVRGKAEVLGRAKALFRRAVAEAKLGRLAAAKEGLLEAHALLPDDSEVTGMLRVLHHAEQHRQARGGGGDDEGEGGGGARVDDAGVRAALDPSVGSQPGTFRKYAPPPPPTPAAAPEAAAPPPKAADPVAAGAATAAAAEAAAAARPREVDAAPAAATPAAPMGTAAAGGKVTEQRFRWAREWLEGRLVRLACQAEDGSIVAVSGTRSFSGEASVTRSGGARARVVRSFDLSFELEWQAVVGGERFGGQLVFGGVASHNEPHEYELSVNFDARPPEGSEAEADLVGLIGPLRMHAALDAEGRLTQKVWEALAEFGEAFDAATRE